MMPPEESERQAKNEEAFGYAGYGNTLFPAEPGGLMGGKKALLDQIERATTLMTLIASRLQAAAAKFGPKRHPKKGSIDL